MRKILLSFIIYTLMVNFAEAQEKARIGLQNLNSREVITCYDNNQYSAEDCAQYFETKGFIRTKYIPSKPAKFDYLTVDTFPTRRWRSTEVTPRW